jgi:membrane-bound lytic murein transglycosylase D
MDGIKRSFSLKFRFFNATALAVAYFISAGSALAATSTVSHDRDDPAAPAFENQVVKTTGPLRFSVDERMRRNKEFWVSIYTHYSSYQALIHDAKYIDRVYEVLDLRGAKPSTRAAKQKWKSVLLSLHRKQARPELWAHLTADEQHVAKLYEDIQEPNKFLNAAHRKRLRLQLGQKDRFLEGLYASGKYLPIMEEIFRKEGLPVELTRLPFVESSFNIRARSKVGASGIWQFMRSTGKLFIQVNDAVDERNDPIRATEAAAKLLKGNYDSLKNWPLAVTAYNHGRKGMMRAVRRVGSDELEAVVGEYHSRSFGFASSNFFTELLGAIEAEKNADRYFGKVARARILEGTEVTIPDYIDFRELCKFLKLEPRVLRDLNPALSDSVFKGSLLVPAGYVLRLPADPTLARDAQSRIFLAGYDQIPTLYKQRAQKGVRYVR